MDCVLFALIALVQRKSFAHLNFAVCFYYRFPFHSCQMAIDANFPFAYSKYSGQAIESKVNSGQNLRALLTLLY